MEAILMKAEEIRNLNWVKVENWGDITQTEYGRFNKRFIGKEKQQRVVSKQKTMFRPNYD